MGVFTLLYETEYKPGLEAAITDALREEVSTIVIAEAEASAQENVYDAYDPDKYIRRESLLDDESYTSVVNGNELTLYAHVDGNPMYRGTDGWDPGDITEIIERGYRYHWKNSRIFKGQPYPRPWMDKAIENGLADGQIELALEIGLQRQGF